MNAEIRHIRTAAEQTLLDAFPAYKANLPGAQAERADAFRIFEVVGLPHRRVEEWKYTDLRALMREAKPMAAKPSADVLKTIKIDSVLPGIALRRLVLVNGTFIPELSDMRALEDGLTITSLADALVTGKGVAAVGKTVPTQNIAVALNTAFMTDGLVIDVAKGVQIERPIAILHFFTGAAAAVFTRSLITVGADARLSVIETFEGPAGVDYQVNGGLEIIVGDRAHVDHIAIGREGDKAIHLNSIMARVGADAKFHDFAFTMGSAVTRNQVFLHLAGERIAAELRGANLLRGRQHVDSTLVVDHASTNGVSREVFKSVLDDESRSVFQGKIIVRPGAQKTDGKMMANALLLSDMAEANAKPELEIFADDVVCGHGATAGALDEDLLFYLKARGIPPKEAEALLIQSFVGEAIEGIEHEGIRELLMDATAQWLKARGS